MSEADLRKFLMAGRVEEMEPHERILFYEQVGIPAARRDGDRTVEAGGISNAGLAYADEQRFEEALDCFTRSLAIYTDLGDEAGQAFQTNHLGIAESGLRRFEEARRHFETAFAEAVRLELAPLISTSGGNLLTALDEVGPQLEFCLKVESQARKHGLADLAIRAGRVLAGARAATGSRQAAGAALDRALLTAIEHDHQSVVAIARELEDLGVRSGTGYRTYSALLRRMRRGIDVEPTNSSSRGNRRRKKK